MKKGGENSKMKNKKTSEEIREIILEKLKDGPKTITEISGLAKSNWITIEEYLRKLKEEKSVIEIVSSPKMKVYRRTDDLVFYGLPFSKKIRDRTFALLCLIDRTWKKQTGSSPPRTILQKVAVKLIEESRIDLPILKFHYGQITALRYDEKFRDSCHDFHLIETQKTLLFNLIKKYKRWSSTKAQLEQYQKPEMEFYRVKEELSEAFSKGEKEKIIKKILELSVYYPSELEDTYELFDKFEYCAINILSLKTKEKENYLKMLKEIFSLIWDAITTSYFFYEAEKYIEENKEELFNYIKLNTMNSKISNIIPIIEDLKSEIDAIPQEEIDMEASEKSKELLNKLLNGL